MTFIVDSAGTTIINSDRVDLPVVKQLRTAPVTISANDAMDSWKVVSIRSLGLGKVEMRDVNVLSRGLPQLEAQLKTEIDGILGADVLIAWDSVSLDYRRKTLLLEGAHCGDEQDARRFGSKTNSLRRD